MLLRKSISLMFLLIFTLSFQQSIAQQDMKMLPEEAIEGIFQFTYSKFVPHYIPAVVFQDSVFIPVSYILSLVKIFNEYNPEKKQISGFYIHKDTLYEYNFMDDIGKIGSKEVSVGYDNYFVSDFEIYAKPIFFKKLFGFDLHVSMETLDINLFSFQELPVLLSLQREKDYENLGLDSSGYAPLLYDRSWNLFNGGIIDYGLTFNIDNDKNKYYNVNLNIGTEILGGALQFTTTGTYDDLSNNYLNYTSWNWNYYFNNAPYLTQLSAGYVSNLSYRNSVLPPTIVTGLQISNEKVRMNHKFMDYIIEDRTGPDWQVELWLNKKLYDQVTADPFGNYRFVVPIKYGNTYVETKHYGLDGQYDHKLEEFSVPELFLKPGDIKYTLTAGKAQNYRTVAMTYKPYMADLRLSVGITNWLTNEVMFQKHEGRSDFDFFNHTGFRLLDGYLIPSLDYAYQKMYSTSLMANHPLVGFYNISYSKYNGVSNYNVEGKKWDVIISGNPPIMEFINGRTNFNFRRAVYDQSKLTEGEVNLRIRTNPLDFDFKYKARYIESDISYVPNYLTHGILSSVLYYWRERKKIWSVLGTTAFKLTTGFDIPTKSFSGLNLLITQTLSNLGYFRVNTSHHFDPSFTSVNLQLIFNLDIVRSTTQSTLSKYGQSYSQEFSGVLGLDSYKWDIYMNNPNGGSTVGRGAAAMRFFLDENANSLYDEGEEALPSIDMDLSNSARVIGDEDNVIKRAYNLYPYTRYNVHVDKESFANPLWIPTRMNFSFIADPNSYKPIDIPCYTAGVVEGTVMKSDGKKSKPQNRVKVHIVNVDSTYDYHEVAPVFSDGSFYLMGVPPGKYRAYVDSSQVDILHVTALAPMKEFEVKRTTDGDFVSGVDFELVPERLADYIADGKLVLPDKKDDESSLTNTTIPDVRDNSNNEFDPGESSIEMGDKRQRVTIEANVYKRFFFADARSTELSDEMKSYLDAVVEYMTDNPRAILKVIGFSDDIGNYEEAQAISLQRAEAACQYLIDNGLQRSRLFPTGKGDREPIDYKPDSSGINRGVNRRIEIQVVD